MKTILDKITHISYDLEAKRPEGYGYGCGGIYSLSKAKQIKKKLLKAKFADGSNEFNEVKIYKVEHYKKVSEIK